MANKVMVLLVAIILAGCASSTFPVQGIYKKPADSFNGEVTINPITRIGTLAFTTVSGITCSGRYGVSSKFKSTGEFICNNNEYGTFTVSAADGRGHGVGKLNGGKTFVFRFGESMTGNCADCHNKYGNTDDFEVVQKYTVLDRLF